MNWELIDAERKYRAEIANKSITYIVVTDAVLIGAFLLALVLF